MMLHCLGKHLAHHGMQYMMNGLVALVVIIPNEGPHWYA